MKRIIVIFFLVIFTSLYSHSQGYRYNKGLATLSVGVAIPAYDFGTGAGILLSSYAKLGTNITGEISYMQNWNLGYTFMFTYSVNSVDTDGLAEGYMNASPAFKTVSAESEVFRDFAGLAGLVFDLPITDDLSFTCKMMGGLRNVYKPSALIETTTIYSEVNYYESNDSQTLMAFLFSGGARVKIDDIFSLHLNASYMGSTISFDYYRNAKEIIEKSHFGILSFTAGVSYSF